MKFAASMAYRVDLSDRALTDLVTLYVEKHAAESLAAARWFHHLEEAIYSLEALARRNPIAPESRKERALFRHLLYGRKPHVYRVIYQIDERRKRVKVYTIRHGAMEPADLTESDD
jgi:toxin ParE1/3/4